MLAGHNKDSTRLFSHKAILKWCSAFSV